MAELLLRPENLEVLVRKAPALAERIAALKVPADHRLILTTDGKPRLVVAGLPLDHAENPEAAAVRWARRAVDRLTMARAERAVVVGLGLGYHLEALATRFGGEIAIVEPELAIWRLALAARDLSTLLQRAAILAEAPPAATGSPVARTLVLPYAPTLLLPGGAHRRALAAWQTSAISTGLVLRVLVVSPTYGGSWPLAGLVARALGRLGHDARLLDLAPFHRGLREIERFGARRARRAELEARYCDMLATGIAAAAESIEPDLVIAMAQAPLGPDALDAIARCGALRALWFVEDFRRMTYWREMAQHYDYIFTIQEGECWEQMRAVSDAHLAYLPCAFDPEVHRPISLSPQESATYSSDVSFVGAGYRNRRKVFRRFLDLDFRIWGSDWEGAVELARVIQREGARISTEESVRIFNATQVNLNLHSSTYHDDVDPRGDFVNPRTFELAGCGAFQIVDQRSCLPALFEAGSELVAVSSGREMSEATRYYLAHPEERRQVAERGRARALSTHTALHRVQSLLGTVFARDGERLLARRRTTTIGEVAASAEGPLRDFLSKMDGRLPFNIDAVVRSVPERVGALDEAEAIFLFLHQFDELYLREARA